MPLYSDMYYNYLNNVPTSTSYSQPSSSSPYSLSTYTTTGYSSPYTPSVRSGTGVSRYMPKLTTISETPLSKHRLAALTRINAIANKTNHSIVHHHHHQSPKYVPPRPRRIDASDIDVSFTRFANRKLNESHEITQIKEENVTVKENSEDDEFPPKNRSTIKRDRGLVRLRTIRAPAEVEKKNVEKVKESAIDFDPGYGSSERSSGSWRKKFELDFDFREKPLSPTAKTLGESFIEKYQIKEPEKSPDVKLLLSLDDLPPEREELLRRTSNGKLPTFKEICSDISSDKLTDDLNAGDLRRRASLIIEEEMNKIMKSESGTFHCILEQITSDDEKRKSRKGKKIRQKLTAKISVDNPEPPLQIKAVIANVEIEETAFKAADKAPEKQLINTEPEDINTTFKVPLKKKKKLVADAEATKNTCNSAVSSTPSEMKIAETKACTASSSESLINMKPKHTTDLNTKLLIDKSATTAPGESQQVVKKTQKNLVKMKASIKSEVPSNTSRESRNMIPLQKDLSVDDFWGMIGSRETTAFLKRKQRVNEDQMLKITENSWIDDTIDMPIEEDERNKKLTKILESKVKNAGDEIAHVQANNLNVDRKLDVNDEKQLNDSKIVNEAACKEPILRFPKKVEVKVMDKPKTAPWKKEIAVKKEPEAPYHAKQVTQPTNKIQNATMKEEIEGNAKKLDAKPEAVVKKVEIKGTIGIKSSDRKDEKSVQAKVIEVRKIEEIKVPEIKPVDKKFTPSIEAKKTEKLLDKKEEKSVIEVKKKDEIAVPEANKHEILPKINSMDKKIELKKPIEAKKTEEKSLTEVKKKDECKSVNKIEEIKVLGNTKKDVLPEIKSIDKKIASSIDDVKKTEKLVDKREEIKPSEAKLEQKPVAKRLLGKATAKAPIEKKIEISPNEITNNNVLPLKKDEKVSVNDETTAEKMASNQSLKVNDQVKENSLNDACLNEKEKKETEEMKETSELLNESANRKKPLGTLSKFPTLNNLNSIAMNNTQVTEDNREKTTTKKSIKSIESEKLIEQISVAIESSEATPKQEKNKKQEESASESDSEESSYEESSEEEFDEMGKKDFNPQRKVKIKVDFTKMQKFFTNDAKSNIKLVARPRPLWKIKRNRHAKFSDSDSESSDGENEEAAGGGSTTGGSQSSTNSDKVIKKPIGGGKKASDLQNENIVALMQLLNVNENNNHENEDDEVKKKSRFSTSSQDSGYSAMSGPTAARSPRKALGECISINSR